MSSERSGRLSRLLFWPVPVVALVGAVVVVHYHRGNAAPVAAAETSRAPELQQEVDILRARMGALERQAGRQAAAPAGGAPAQAGPAVARAGEKKPAGPPPATDDDRRRYFVDLKARFDAEPRDPAWAAGTEEKLRHTGDGQAAGLSIETARCGQATCRVEVRRDPEQVTPVMLVDYVRRAAAVLPEIVVDYPEDPTRVVLYLQKQDAAGFPPMVGTGDPGTD